MTANPADRPFDPLDLYLDGALHGAELEAFERRLASDPALRRVVDQHRRIEAGLKQSFEPPAISISLPLHAATPAPAARSASAPRSSFKFPAISRVLLYAAVISIVAVAAWWQLTPRSTFKAAPLTMGAVFAKLSSNGFKPEFVCTTDEKFNDTMQHRFGEGLLIASAPNIELIGWAYSDNYGQSVISKNELILMAKVDGKETLVFMDRKEHEPGFLGFGGVKEAPPPGMHVFRREVGGYVLYELTSASSPTLADRAYVPESKK
ncbi:MAG: hypothetical protein JNK58_05495 [Phycisphaerae bacterium]|nr:hypothetical protein [Phycisphaerae bacterium]